MPDEAARIRTWLSDAALPLWGNYGVDREGGGFVERLNLATEPDWAATKRVRVQARQIYVYAHAALLGLYPQAIDVAAQGYRFLLAHALPDGLEAGFIHAVTRDGRVCDARRDSYDHAFILFAFSWYARASQDRGVTALLRPLAEVIWRLFRHPSGAGILIDTSGTLELHQNPHMHLFEALLAAYDTTNDAWFLERAGEMNLLFRTRMFDQSSGVLREFYDQTWRPVAGERGDVVEPGHHCEWIWLLKRYADRISAPLCDEAIRLFDYVERHARTRDAMLLCDQLRSDGSVIKADTRIWPQTEAIKADIALAETRGSRIGPRTDTIVDDVFMRFLNPAVPGGWIDWTDAYGEPLVRFMPASSFYHIFLAFSEYLIAHDAA